MNIYELKQKLTKWENQISFNSNCKVILYLEKDVRSGYYDITDVSIIDQNEVYLDADFDYIEPEYNEPFER